MVTSVVELSKNCVSGSDFGKVWFQFQFRFRLQKISSTVLKNVQFCTLSCLYNVRSHIVSNKGGLTLLIF
jgi:hypothetical protein